MKRTAATIAVLMVIAAVIVLAARPGGRSDASSRATSLQRVATAELKPADFSITLPVEGVLGAAKSVPILNLVQDTQVVWVLNDGVTVKAGDVVMKLNPADVKKNFDRLQNDVAEAEDRVRQEQATSEKQVQNARTSLAKAEESLRLAVVQAQEGVEKAQAEVNFLEKEVDVAQGQFDKRKRLLEERLLPITEVERAEDELRDKRFTLEAARKTLERAQVDASTTKRLREMDVQTAKIGLAEAEANLAISVAGANRDLAQKQSDLQDERERMDSMEVKAPVGGMLLLGNSYQEWNRPLRVGDRLWEGQNLANIVDPKGMTLSCDINEADIDLVKVGQEAQVRVPAIGSTTLTGKLKSLDSLARQRDPFEGGAAGGNAFPAMIELAWSNPKLRPGMGATVDIVLERVKKGISAPLECLFLKGDGYIVYRAEGDVFREVPVKVLKRNNTVAAIEGRDGATMRKGPSTGLRAGDKVARERPPEALVALSGRER